MAKKISTHDTARKVQRIMVVAAHPDDAELALGGALATWSALGVETLVVDLTDGEPTPYGSARKRMKEALTATRILDLAERRCLGFKNRELTDSRATRRSLASVIRQFQPSIIFSHYWSDVHPDHIAACAITESARFYAKLSKTTLPGEPFFVPRIFYYPSIHIRLREIPSLILDASAGRMQKMDAIRAYSSQFIDNPKNRAILKRVETDGEYWGNQVNVDFGEPIYSREPVGVTPLALLLNEKAEKL